MAHSVLRRFAQIAATFALLASTSTLPVVAQETETAVRVMVSDAGNGDLTVLDPASGEVVGRFTTPVGGYSALYPSSTGRYLLANHYAGDQVTIVDAGVALEPHGDHADLVIEAPFVLATVATGPTPAHGWAHDGVVAIHNDGDGTITLFDEAEMGEAIAPEAFAVAQPDHAAIATLGDAMLVGYYDLGRIDAYSLDGELLAEGIAPCTAAHGEARFGEAIAFGCGEGLLFVTRNGEDFASQMVRYPGAISSDASAEADATASPEAETEQPRSGTLAAHHDSNVLVGNFGEGLALVSPDADGYSFDVLPLPAEPLGFAYDQQGERLAVLTDDGSVHGIDPARGEILWTTLAVTPYTEIELGDGFDFYPSLAASDEAAYVADPKTGEVVELNLESGEVTNRFAIGGQPARVALVQASGAGH
jgi:DNA-binding beta-propeller fold protein YncE